MKIPPDGRVYATLEVASDGDVALARRRVSEAMTSLGARPIRKTRFVTAVSEIARNAVKHGGGATLTVYLHDGPARVSIVCADRGAGIVDIEAALSDGFSTVGSMGRGLGGAQRLADAFEIETAPGKGTIVRMLAKA